MGVETKLVPQAHHRSCESPVLWMPRDSGSLNPKLGRPRCGLSGLTEGQGH